MEGSHHIILGLCIGATYKKKNARVAELAGRWPAGDLVREKTGLPAHIHFMCRIAVRGECKEWILQIEI